MMKKFTKRQIEKIAFSVHIINIICAVIFYIIFLLVDFLYYKIISIAILATIIMLLFIFIPVQNIKEFKNQTYFEKQESLKLSSVLLIGFIIAIILSTVELNQILQNH